MKLIKKWNYETILDHIKENDKLYINFFENKIYINKIPKNLKNYHLLTKKDLFINEGLFKNENGTYRYRYLTNVYHPFMDNVDFDLDQMELME